MRSVVLTLVFALWAANGYGAQRHPFVLDCSFTPVVREGKLTMHIVLEFKGPPVPTASLILPSSLGSATHLEREITNLKNVHQDGRVTVTYDLGEGLGCAVNNSILHSEAAIIRCDLSFSKQEIRFLCQDNGKGIPADILRAGSRDGHWGFIGMRERARRIGGDLKIESHPAEGTKVEIRIDARSHRHKDHFS